MDTGRTIALIKALGAGGGGGGGSEEQFVKVYETTITDPATLERSDTVVVNASDMGGSYIDMIADIELPDGGSYTSLTGVFIGGQDNVIFNKSVNLTAGDFSHAVIGVQSVGGMCYGTSSVADFDTETSAYESGFAADFGMSLTYPTNTVPSIHTFVAYLDNDILANTSIKVYARKKVA